jgi:uncharacterized protein YlxW (UPF0749 family)
MAAWLIPALKAVLPHVGDIISAARPVFTGKRPDSATNPAALLQQQIAELQSAASQNAAHVQELAAQLQSTVAALEHDAAQAEERLRRATMLCVAAIAFSAIALGVSVFLILTR